MNGLLVLHDLGDPNGGSPWAGAFSAAGWSGEVLAPDLPGHAGAPAPLGGSYHVSDPAVTGALALAGRSPGYVADVVVGVGASGWAAHLLALGSRARLLVLVDGLPGPWLDADATVAAEREWLRGVSDDEDAVAPSPPDARLDPRLAHGVPPQTDRDLALRAAAALPVPVLVVETGAHRSGSLSADEAAELVAAFPGAEVVRIDDSSAHAVARAVVGWAGGV